MNIKDGENTMGTTGNDTEFDDIGDVAEFAADPGGGLDDELAAPRRAGGGGKSRTLVLLVLMLLVAGGLGGGYFYFTTMMQDPAPPAPAMMAEAPAPEDIAPAPEPGLEEDADLLAETGETPPLPPVMEDGGTDMATPPETGNPEQDMAGGDPLGEILPFEETPPPEDESAIPSGDLQFPESAEAEDPAQITQAAEAPVPAMEEAAGTETGPEAAEMQEAAADNSPAPTPEEAPGTEPAPGMDLAMEPEPAPAMDMAAQEAAPPVPEDMDITPGSIPVEAAPEEEPPADLPVPEEMTQAEAEAEPAPGTENMTVPAQPAEKPGEPAPAVDMTAAEQAIIDNAPALDQLSADAAPLADVPAAQDIAAQDALIRPLPEQYLVVKKQAAGDDVDARLAAARGALAQGRVRAALALFSELERERPDDTRALMGHAVSLQRLGMREEALASYEKVLVKEPKNLEALTNMLGLLREQDPGLALGKLQELRDVYPANADINAQLGIAYGGAGEYDLALKYLDIAEALAPGSAYVVYNKAVVHDRMGNGAQAAALYRQILRLAAEGGLNQPLPLDAIRGRLAVLR